MSKKYAVIFNTFVENIIRSDLPANEIFIEPDRILVEVSDNLEIGAGYRYDGSNFIEPLIILPSSENIIQDVASLIQGLNEEQRNSLIKLLSGQV